MIVDRDVPMTMRDGAVLRADVYRPQRDGPHPAVLNRTPYDRSLSLTPPAALDPESAVAAGLALVCQDVRGQYSSEGVFYPFRSEEADGFDSVEWVAAQRWCNGKVAMAGRSYSGATQWLAAAARPPHLEAIFPVVAGSDYYDGWIYQGGAFQLGFNLFWVQLMTAPKARGSLTEQYRHLPLTDPPLLDAGPAGRFYRDWLAHPDRRRVLAGPCHQPSLRPDRGAGVQRRRLVRPASLRHARELLPHAQRGGDGARPFAVHGCSSGPGPTAAPTVPSPSTSSPSSAEEARSIWRSCRSAFFR